MSSAPLFGVGQFVSYWGVCYRVEEVLPPDGTGWGYTLREADGDGEILRVPESMIEKAFLESPHVSELRKSLDKVLEELQVVEEAVHAELDHADAMLKCSAFSQVRQDVEQVRSALGEINSARFRAWHAVHDAANLADQIGG